MEAGLNERQDLVSTRRQQQGDTSWSVCVCVCYLMVWKRDDHMCCLRPSVLVGDRVNEM